MGASKEIIFKLSYHKCTFLFTARQGHGLNVQRFFAREDAYAILASLKGNGRNIIAMHLGTFCQFAQYILLFASGSHAVQFLNGNYIRRFIDDDIGYALIVTYSVHAFGVTHIVTHQLKVVLRKGG